MKKKKYYIRYITADGRFFYASRPTAAKAIALVSEVMAKCKIAKQPAIEVFVTRVNT